MRYLAKVKEPYASWLNGWKQALTLGMGSDKPIPSCLLCQIPVCQENNNRQGAESPHFTVTPQCICQVNIIISSVK